ncbi:MAG TPA: DUF1501 domain-containing protein [Planctomycetota bacterium]|nr:DUF1501 domain-containing protein [Planctomycetota bacterium]
MNDLDRTPPQPPSPHHPPRRGVPASCCDGVDAASGDLAAPGIVRSAFTRRDALRLSGLGFAWLAFGGLTSLEARAAAPLRRQDPDDDPLAPKPPHFQPRAKRVIFLCMSGAPSHVDTFDHKPELAKRDGQTYATGRARGGAKLLASPWAFRPSGRSGLPISELFPETAKHADDLCLLHGMTTDVPAHAQASLKLHTGSFQFVRPSLGAWTLYGLGTTNRNVPGFVTLNPPAGQGGAQNYGAAFLPAYYQGQRVGVEGRVRGGRGGAGGDEPVEDIRNDRLSIARQRKQLEFVQRLNRERRQRERDDGVDGVIQSYELAFRMQAEVPALLDLAGEPKEVLDLYGAGAGPSAAFGRQCLLARRFAEAGVRFVQVNAGGWDHHAQLRDRLPQSCAQVDRPIAGLLADLKRRGLLKDTLVLWGGEFGRTPYAQNGDGRDHNHKGFTVWMAGGGVKGGYAHGATDDVGAEAVQGKMSMHDLHATVLHLLGLDHEKLTFNYAGRDFRLTDVHGAVAKEVLA